MISDSQSEELKSTAKLLKTLVESNVDSETTRCQVITSMLLAEWQAKGHWAPGSAPSFVLVNAGADPDPCWRLPKTSFRSDLPVRDPKAPTDDPLAILPEAATTMMTQIIADTAKAKPAIPPNCYSTEQTTASQRWWALCQKALYGSATTGYYGCHNPIFGLASTLRGHTSLWVESKLDLSRLQADIRDGQSPFWRPWGYNADFKRVPMMTSIIGSIPASLWTAELVKDAISASIVFLPHVAPLSTTLLSQKDCGILLGLATPGDGCTSSGMVVPCNSRFPELYRQYEAALRHRLRNLPPDYEFHILSLIRHLHSRTVTLVSKLKMPITDNAQAEWAVKLLTLTYEAALRGITFGIEALVFFCRGLPIAGESFENTTKVLAHVRARGTCSGRDLSRRFQNLSTDARYQILSRLEDEGLIIAEGKKIRAVSCQQFFESLPDRSCIPLPLTWDEIVVPDLDGAGPKGTPKKKAKSR